MDHALKPCPCCGAAPKLCKMDTHGSHGCNEPEWMVKCDCGMRTRGVTHGYEGTDQQCQQMAASIWNRRTSQEKR